METIRIYFVLLCILGLGLSGRALPLPPVEPSQPLSLQEALLRALETSPNLESARSKVRLAELKIAEAYVPLQPTASYRHSVQRDLHPQVGGGDVIDALYGVPVPTNQASPYLSQGALTIRQTIFTFGKVHWGALAAKLAAKQAVQEYRTALETLLREVESKYVEVQLADVNISIAERRLALRKDFLKVSQALYKAGEVAGFDIMQYQTSVTQAEQALLAQKNQRELGVSSLLVLLDQPMEGELSLLPFSDPPAPPPGYQDGLARALRHRPEMAALRWSLASAEANVGYAARTSAPSLGLEMDLNAQPAAPYNWTAALVLQFPLLDGGAASIQKQQAEEAVRQLRQDVISTQRQVTTEVRAAWLRMASLWKQLGVARQASEEGRRALKIAAMRYREGESSSSQELLQTQETQTSAEEALAQVQADYWLARVDWRRAISEEYAVSLPENLRVDWELPEPGETGGKALP